MRNRTLHLNMQTDKQFSTRLKIVIIAVAIICGSQSVFAQNVGINTNNPDPSASLEVAGTNKGLLIPRISLQSLTDNATIPNPATSLLIYNTNAGVGKKGFYYNSGTAGNPTWANVGESLTFPFYNSNGITGTAFYLENGALSTSAIGIHSVSNYGTGLQGSTVTGRGVAGYTFQNGIGVLAEAQNTIGTALKVSGKINIAGPGQSPGAGKVLTSDANGNATWQKVGDDAVAFSASGVKGQGSQNISPDNIVKVAFATENYDIGSNYNDVNGVPHSTFTASISGIYHFDVQLSWKKGANPTYTGATTLVRIRGGVSYKLAEYAELWDDYAVATLSVDCLLLQGDTVHVEAYTPLSEGISLDTTDRFSFFNGRLVLKQ